MIARHLIIVGRVQGVGYRDWLRQQARLFGLSGWVRNRVDGTVEALLSGHEADVLAACAACRHGPRHARVDSITETIGSPPNEPGFNRLPTL